MSNNSELGQYDDALKADRDARTVIKWAKPIIIFGWIIVVIAAIVLVGSFIVVLIGISQGTSALAAALPAVVLTSAVIVLQGSVFLVIGYYLRMRAFMVRYQIGSALSED